MLSSAEKLAGNKRSSLFCVSIGDKDKKVCWDFHLLAVEDVPGEVDGLKLVPEVVVVDSGDLGPVL
jgi:hypothetical protein